MSVHNRVYLQKTLTASLGAVLHASGEPVTVYGWHTLRSAAAAGRVDLYSGAIEDPAKLVISENTASNVTSTVFYPFGIQFPDGCLIDSETTNLTALTVFYTLANE